jgi:hypothetical protein
MPLAGFKPKIPKSDRPQTHALDRKATGIGSPYGNLGLSNDMIIIVWLVENVSKLLELTD